MQTEKEKLGTKVAGTRKRELAWMLRYDRPYYWRLWITHTNLLRSTFVFMQFLLHKILLLLISQRFFLTTLLASCSSPTTLLPYIVWHQGEVVCGRGSRDIGERRSRHCHCYEIDSTTQLSWTQGVLSIYLVVLVRNVPQLCESHFSCTLFVLIQPNFYHAKVFPHLPGND